MIEGFIFSSINDGSERQRENSHVRGGFHFFFMCLIPIFRGSISHFCNPHMLGILHIRQFFCWYFCILSYFRYTNIIFLHFQQCNFLLFTFQRDFYPWCIGIPLLFSKKYANLGFFFHFKISFNLCVCVIFISLLDDGQMIFLESL